MQVENIPIEQVIPYARNPRRNDAAVAGVAASIKEFGFQNPIIIDKENSVIAGHTRLLAARQLQLKEVPCLRAEKLTKAQVKAYRLLDNKLAERAEWDDTLLREELVDLEELGFDLDPYDVDFDNDIGQEEVNTEEDEVPEAPKEAFSKLGDVWLCGKHRVMCGDSASEKWPEDIELCFTSPPYGELRDYGKCDLSVDTLTRATFANRARFICVNLGILRRDHEIVEYWNDYISAARKLGLKLLSWCVWDKDAAGGVSNQTAMISIIHEWVFVFGEKEKELNRIFSNDVKQNEERRKHYVKDKQGRLCVLHRQSDGSTSLSPLGREFDKKQMGTVLVASPHLGNDLARKNHPATMPIELVSTYIESFTNEGQSVCDPFLGSGTTLIAAERLNRICYGMEIEPRYVDVICQRFYNETKQVPVRESDLVPFPVEVADGK